MKHTSMEQRMMMCPQCLSKDGHYSEIDQSLHEKFGMHATYNSKTGGMDSWRCGPNDKNWKGERVKCL